jgi:hypothetical protein
MAEVGDQRSSNQPDKAYLPCAKRSATSGHTEAAAPRIGLPDGAASPLIRYGMAPAGDLHDGHRLLERVDAKERRVVIPRTSASARDAMRGLQVRAAPSRARRSSSTRSSTSAATSLPLCSTLRLDDRCYDRGRPRPSGQRRHRKRKHFPRRLTDPAPSSGRRDACRRKCAALPRPA